MGWPITSYDVLHALSELSSGRGVDEEHDTLAKALRKFCLIAVVLHDPVHHSAMQARLDQDFQSLDVATGRQLLFLALLSRRSGEDALAISVERSFRDLLPSWAHYVGSEARDPSFSAVRAARSLGVPYEALPLIAVFHRAEPTRASTTAPIALGHALVRTSPDTLYPDLCRLGAAATTLSHKDSSTPCAEELERHGLRVLRQGRSDESCSGCSGSTYAADALALALAPDSTRFRHALVRDRFHAARGRLLAAVQEYRRELAALCPPEFETTDAFGDPDLGSQIRVLEQQIISNLENWALATGHALRTEPIAAGWPWPESPQHAWEPQSQAFIQTAVAISTQPELPDWSPIAISYVKALEVEIVSGLVQWARSRLGIAMPEYYMAFQRGVQASVRIPNRDWSVDLNQQAQDGTWLPAALGQSLLACRHVEGPAGVDGPMWDLLFEHGQRAARIRNQAAHTNTVDRETAFRCRDAVKVISESAWFDILFRTKYQLREGSSSRTNISMSQAIATGSARLVQLLHGATGGVPQDGMERRAALFSAISCGAPEVCRSMLAQGFDPSSTDSDGRNSLIHAVSRRAAWGHDDQAAMDVVQLLVQQNGVDVNVADQAGDTALLVALAHLCSPWCRRVVAALLGAGADPNKHNPNSRLSPVHAALRTWDTEAFALLVENGSDPDTRAQSGQTPLMAALRLCFPVLEDNTLVTRLGDVNARDDRNNSALLLAAESRGPEIVRRLLDLGANINQANVHGTTPLIAAALRREPAVAELLLEHPDVDIHAAQADGTTALIAALRIGHDRLAASLLDRGASAAGGADDDHHVRSPLLLAAESRGPEIVRRLLDLGANINQANVHGTTPLIAAAQRRDPAVAELLLEAPDVNLDAAQADGTTALVAALRKGHDRLAASLLDRGANAVGANVDLVYLATQFRCHRALERLTRAGLATDGMLRGATPLMHACTVCDTKMVAILLAAGADPNLRDTEERTPLHRALRGIARRRRTATVTQLLRCKANPNIADRSGLTPAHVAAQTGQFESLARLLLAGADLHATDQSGRGVVDHCPRGRESELAGQLRRVSRQLERTDRS